MKSFDKITLLIFLFAFLLRLNFALYTPNWQAADEYPHFFVIKYLALTESYPKSEPNFPYYEAYQPPLYYYIAQNIYNILKSYDYPSPKINENFDPDTLTYPLNVSLIGLRLLSVLFGMITIFLIYKNAILFFKDYTAIYVLLIAATLPSFVVNSSSVTNDALSNLFGALILFLITKDFENVKEFSFKKSILIGFILGLALLTKANLYPYLFLILIGLFFHPITLKEIFKNYLIIIITALLLASFYFYLNINNYNSLLVISPGIEKNYFLKDVTINQVIHAFRNFFWSFWAAAGRIYQIHLDGYSYIILFLPITLISFIGITKYIFAPKFLSEGRVYYFYFHLITILIFLFSALYFNLISEQHSAWGRYMYPALSSFLILFVFGLRNIINLRLFSYTVAIFTFFQVLINGFLFYNLVSPN